MTLDQLIEKCPSLRYTNADFEGSSKKRLATRHIVEDLIKIGWVPVDYYLGRGENKNNKHAIVFDTPIPALGIKSPDEMIIPQVFLVGDNGLTPFRFYICFFRPNCNNRIFIPIKHSKNLTIKNFYISFRAHNYNTNILVNNIIELLLGVIEGSKKIFEYAEKKPRDIDIKNFAGYAFLRRKDIKSRDLGKHIKSIPKNTLSTLTENESGSINTVWDLFNIVHRRIIEGFEVFPSRSSKRTFKYRSINSLEKFIKVNVNLYLDIFKIMH